MDRSHTALLVPSSWVGIYPPRRRSARVLVPAEDLVLAELARATIHVAVAEFLQNLLCGYLAVSTEQGGVVEKIDEFIRDLNFHCSSVF
jgi:hypothetical protein